MIYLFPVQFLPTFSSLLGYCWMKVQNHHYFVFVFYKQTSTNEGIRLVSSQHENLYSGLSMFQLRIARSPWLFQQVGEIKEIFSKSYNFLFYPQLSLWQQIFTVKSAVPGEQKVLIPSKYRGHFKALDTFSLLMTEFLGLLWSSGGLGITREN